MHRYAFEKNLPIFHTPAQLYLIGNTVAIETGFFFLFTVSELISDRQVNTTIAVISLKKMKKILISNLQIKYPQLSSLMW